MLHLAKKSKNKNSPFSIDMVKDFFNFLLVKFPQKEPVVLVRRKNLSNYGYYSFNGDKHYICILKRENEEEMQNDLIHEWGHLLDYQQIIKDGKDDNSDPHSDSWGVKFAITYRAYLEFLDIRNKEG